jgi:hypothetical protein
MTLATALDIFNALPADQQEVAVTASDLAAYVSNTAGAHGDDVVAAADMAFVMAIEEIVQWRALAARIGSAVELDDNDDDSDDDGRIVAPDDMAKWNAFATALESR